MNGSKIFLFERISTLKEYKDIFWRFLFLGKYIKKKFKKYVIISFLVNVNKSLENSSSNNNIIKYEPTKVLRKCLQRRKDSNKNQRQWQS